MSERLRIDPNAPEELTLKAVVEVLSAGGLVVSPTETRYGILARADRRDVLEKLYRAKGRSTDKPTSVLVEQPGDVDRLAEVNEPARRLIKAFLPGPLTLVLKSRESWFPPVVVDGKIGIRCSPVPFLSRLVAAFEEPLTATSANRAGKPDFETVDEIEREFRNEFDLYIEAGPLTGRTSTVVDCSGRVPMVLREGSIDSGRIKAAWL